MFVTEETGDADGEEEGSKEDDDNNDNDDDEEEEEEGRKAGVKAERRGEAERGEG